jgi:hypothetical protein
MDASDRYVSAGSGAHRVEKKFAGALLVDDTYANTKDIDTINREHLKRRHR